MHTGQIDVGGQFRVREKVISYGPLPGALAGIPSQTGLRATKLG